MPELTFTFTEEEWYDITDAVETRIDHIPTIDAADEEAAEESDDVGDDADPDRGPRRFSGGLSAALTGRSIEDVDTPAHETTARVDTERQVAR